MKGVLVSIQPKWCQLIADKKKVVEVRKTRPKLEIPFKVYIYCTKGRGDCLWEWCGHIAYDTQFPNERPNRLDGKVIGEFVCDEITEYRAEFTDLQYSDARHKKVCQNTIKWVERDDENEETVYRYETSNEEDDPDNCKFLKRSCLTFNEVRKYIGETFFDKPFYGWHISDLKIYDKPKELSEFKHWVNNKDYDGWNEQRTKIIKGFVLRPLTRPPQSWCYVEVER